MKSAGIVIFIHALILLSLLYFHPPQPKSHTRHPVTIQTYVVQEEQPKPTPPKHTPAPPPKSTPKPTIDKPKPKPKPVAKPRPSVKEDPNRDKLVQMMQQSLSSLNKETPAAKTSSPKQISTLASEALSFETAYQDQLITFLEQALTLPEKGDVKLSLTLNRAGHVQAVSVKQTTSERNRTYVESTVPTLLLPPFDKQFKGESTHTFSITLTSS